MEWEEYLAKFVSTWREEFAKLPRLQKESAMKPPAEFYHFLKPCQIEVIDIEKPHRTVIWIVTRDEKRKDMEFVVHSLRDNLQSFFDRKKIEDSIWVEKYRKAISQMLGEYDVSREGGGLWSFIDKTMFYCIFYYDLRTRERDPNEYARREIRFSIELGLAETAVGKQRERIEETVDDIKKDAEAIQVEELRTRIIDKTKKLEDQMGVLDKKFEQQISGLRRTIGLSERFLDWKAFSSDVEHLKETHITKREFEAHIGRLDEKIDKALDALNIRIEDLKAIKFWSKRTLLDIALIIWGTIVTLYAAGILKF